MNAQGTLGYTSNYRKHWYRTSALHLVYNVRRACKCHQYDIIKQARLVKLPIKSNYYNY